MRVVCVSLCVRRVWCAVCVCSVCRVRVCPCVVCAYSMFHVRVRRCVMRLCRLQQLEDTQSGLELTKSLKPDEIGKAPALRGDGLELGDDCVPRDEEGRQSADRQDGRDNVPSRWRRFQGLNR